jgi:acyl-CoA thioester hydrolase
MAAPQDYPHRTEITTRWKDNDVYGHVNNVEYYAYFDTAINEYLIAEGGLDIHTGAEIGLCVESGCRFAASLSFPGRVTAGLRVATLGRTSVRYEIGLFDAASGQLAAEGFFVHVFVDRPRRRPTPIPDRLREALVRILTDPPGGSTEQEQS